MNPRSYNRPLSSNARKMTDSPYRRDGVNGVNLLEREAGEADSDAPVAPYTRPLIIPIGLR